MKNSTTISQGAKMIKSIADMPYNQGAIAAVVDSMLHGTGCTVYSVADVSGDLYTIKHHSSESVVVFLLVDKNRVHRSTMGFQGFVERIEPGDKLRDIEAALGGMVAMANEVAQNYKQGRVLNGARFEKTEQGLERQNSYNSYN